MFNLKVKDTEDLKKQIALRGYSIKSFAKKINVSPSYLSRVLNGKVQPYPPFGRKIAKGLGQNISDIFFTNYVAK